MEKAANQYIYPHILNKVFGVKFQLGYRLRSKKNQLKKFAGSMGWKVVCRTTKINVIVIILYIILFGPSNSFDCYSFCLCIFNRLHCYIKSCAFWSDNFGGILDEESSLIYTSLVVSVCTCWLLSVYFFVYFATKMYGVYKG